MGDGGPADGRRGRRRHRRRGQVRADQGGHRRRGGGGVPRLAGGDGPARSGAGAGRPGLVPPSGPGRPGLRRAGRDRGRGPDPGALDGRLAGPRPGRRYRAGCGCGRRARAGEVPAGRHRAARRDQPVRPGAAGRRAAAGVTGIENLAAARLWAATKFPYLATGVFGAQVIADRGSGTVSADESWRMRADPEVTADWTPAQLGSVLIHHVCHLLRTHGERAQDTGVRPDEAADWIRAADAEINDDLVPAGLELPGHPVLPRDLRAEDGLLAEQYFAGMRRQAGRAAENQARSGPWLDWLDWFD